MKKIVLGIVAILLLCVTGYYFFGSEITDKFASLTKKQDETIKVFLNDNPDSEILMTALSAVGEGLVVIKGEGEQSTFIDKIILVTPEKKTGVMQIGNNHLLESFSYNDTVMHFSNYKDSTVDISVETDGRTESFPDSPLRFPVDDSNNTLSLIPTAHAASPTETREVIESTISTLQNPILNPNQAPSNVGLYMSSLFCAGGAAAATFASGGLAAPLLFTCGQVVVRTVTSVTGYGRCRGDIIGCSYDALWEQVQKSGPGFLRSGLRIQGKAVNSISSSPIPIGTLGAASKQLKDGLRGDWKGGEYAIHFAKPGEYTMTARGAGFTEMNVDVVVLPEKAQIFLPGDSRGIERAYPKNWLGQAYGELDFEIRLVPDGFIVGEVIDFESGSSIADAQVNLLDSSTKVGGDISGEDGTFAIQPPLGKVGKLFTLEFIAEGYEARKADMKLNYDLKDSPSDEYLIDDWGELMRLYPKAEERGSSVWDITFTWGAGTGENEDCMVCLIRVGKPSTLEYTIEGESVLMRWPSTGAMNRIGTVDSGGRIVTKIGNTSVSEVFGSLNFDTGTGEGTWTYQSESVMGPWECRIPGGDCSGIWTAVKKY